MSRRELLPLGALALIFAITAVWWALALWPLPADGPAWIERTRLVCFGSTRDTLPTAAGWSLLIGEPAAMLAALFVVWGREVLLALRTLARTGPGRTVLTSGTLLVLTGLLAAGVRVAHAVSAERFDPILGGLPAGGEPRRLDREAPPLALRDQHGELVRLADLRGRSVVVAFAYRHCATVCPLVVYEVLNAQRQLAEARPAVVLITLDPWRDTPSRLAEIAKAWQLPQDAHVLSGSVEDVNRTLDAWQVPRSRDAATGEITHGEPVYLLDGAGHIRFQAPGYADAIVRLARRL